MDLILCELIYINGVEILARMSSQKVLLGMVLQLNQRPLKRIIKMGDQRDRNECSSSRS